MTASLFTTTQSPLFANVMPVTFTNPQDLPEEQPEPSGLIQHLPSAFAEAMREAMAEALEASDVNAYLRAKRSLRSHYRYHAMRDRDASRFPLSHDDHLAQTAHQFGYHGKGDVERMTVGLGPVSEWRPPLLRKMDASAGVERVVYDVPGVGRSEDWLSASQRDSVHPFRDKDELPSDFELSTIAEAERLGVSVDDFDRPWSLDRPMSAKPVRNLPGCD